MLAYYVEWHMRQVLTPILFDDHDKAAAEAALRRRGRLSTRTGRPRRQSGRCRGVTHRANRNHPLSQAQENAKRRVGSGGEQF
jgi:hypothetical protein